jgi:hypothetical protein
VLINKSKVIIYSYSQHVTSVNYLFQFAGNQLLQPSKPCILREIICSNHQNPAFCGKSSAPTIKALHSAGNHLLQPSKPCILREIVLVHDARDVTDRIYHTITSRVNAATILNGDATYASFINQLNGAIEAMKTTMNQQEAARKKQGPPPPKPV